MKISKLLEQIIAGTHLSTSQMENVIRQCMAGTLSDVEIATFLALMRMKGETVDELTAAAQVMQQCAHHIELGNDLVDIVGTGGDGKNTFNISTVSSFVAAAAGLRVAKHGNRSVSSQSGSADLLLEAGFTLHLPDKALCQAMEHYGITFLFAPHFHEAMRHAKNARQALSIRTLFNLLGPLVNPANVKKQVVGVSSKKWLLPLAQVLAGLGSQHALVINAQDGIDEVSIAAKTNVIEYQAGEFKEWSIDPKEHGCFHSTLNDIVVENPTQSLTLAMSVFAGEKGPARDIILLNTALALYCGDLTSNYSEAITLAANALDSGLAHQRFIQLRDFTQTFKA